MSKKHQNDEDVEVMLNELNRMEREIKKANRARLKYEKSTAVHTFNMGIALQEIKSKKLYKMKQVTEGQHYSSFSHYCLDVFGFSDKYAYRLIAAAKTQQLLEQKQVTSVKIPERLLSRLNSMHLNDQGKIDLWQESTEGNTHRIPTEETLVKHLPDSPCTSTRKGKSPQEILNEIDHSEAKDVFTLIESALFKKIKLDSEQIKAVTNRLAVLLTNDCTDTDTEKFYPAADPEIREQYEDEDEDEDETSTTEDTDIYVENETKNQNSVA